MALGLKEEAHNGHGEGWGQEERAMVLVRRRQFATVARRAWGGGTRR